MYICNNINEYEYEDLSMANGEEEAAAEAARVGGGMKQRGGEGGVQGRAVLVRRRRLPAASGRGCLGPERTKTGMLLAQARVRKPHSHGRRGPVAPALALTWSSLQFSTGAIADSALERSPIQLERSPIQQ